MEITPTELKDRIDRGDELILLDIRKPFELDIAKLENFVHIPEDELMNRLEELERYGDLDIVVYCRTGRRSSEVVALLKSKGLKNVYNLTGGLHAWSDEIDPCVMKY